MAINSIRAILVIRIKKGYQGNQVSLGQLGKSEQVMQSGQKGQLRQSGQSNTLSYSCLKVHAGVPIALIILLDPLVLRINCLVIRELLNPESWILNPQSMNPYLNVNKQTKQYTLLWPYIQYYGNIFSTLQSLTN